MPHFVTHISGSRSAADSTAARRASWGDRTTTSRAYRRRLAALRTRAPEKLYDRVRRELRTAATSSATRE